MEQVGIPDIAPPEVTNTNGGLQQTRTRLDKARVLPTLGALFSVSCVGSIDLNGEAGGGIHGAG